MSNKSTRDIIQEVASKLFAQNGYDNTSIRDISSEAGVNLASVNYHFKNKQNLYKEVMEKNIHDMEVEIVKISAESESVEDFTWKLYLFFSQESNTFINSFKVFVTNTSPLEEEYVPSNCRDVDNFGPPGFKAMLELLTKHVSEDVPLAGRQWAMRVIFNQVVHVALIMGSALVKSMENKIEWLQPEYKKISLTCHTTAILNFLKENPDKFR